MKYRVTHTTAYSYSEPASLSQNELFLTPRSTNRQQVMQTQLSFAPQPQYVHRRIDYFGNVVHVFMIEQPHAELSLTASSIMPTPKTALTAFIHGPALGSSWPPAAPTSSRGAPSPCAMANSATPPVRASPLAPM